MSSVAQTRISPEEYLRLERAAETKSEYDNGVVRAMPVLNGRHNLIVAGIVGTLRPCREPRRYVFPSQMRVGIPRPTRFFYPDVTIVCGEPLCEGVERDILLNPLVIFEVLSESTAAYDRGRKFLAYQALESLQEYVLVSPDEYLVEHYRRHDRQWIYKVVQGPDAVLQLPSAECELPLREIYYQVTFGPESA